MPGPNAPCPCSSGKKFKKCCQYKSSPQDDMLTRDRARTEYIRQKREQHIHTYGHVKQMICIKNNGLMHICVGSTAYWGPWVTFMDFLFEYIRRKLTAEWGNAEIKKAEGKHPIIDLYQKTCHFQKTLERNEQNLLTGTVNGASKAYASLAYDMYVMDHHQHLTDDHLHRLKNKQGFQGVRFEFTAATTLLRAGFTLEFENEKDGDTMHTELVATHPKTGQKFNIEAKSRRRPGVLGWAGERKAEEDLRAEMVPLLNDALKKPTQHPFIIFLDLNLPPEYPYQMTDEWVQRVMIPIINGCARKEADGRDPFWLIVLCNHPDHYPDNNEPAPLGYCSFLFGKTPDRSIPFQQEYAEIWQASALVGVVPQFFDEPIP